MENKKCCFCKLNLSLNSFCKNRLKPDGLSHYCRDCASKRNSKIVGKPTKRCKPPELFLTDLQISYLAGLIDGEGCFSISKNFVENKIKYSPSLDISVTSPELLEIHSQYAVGKIYKLDTELQKKRLEKPVYEWKLGANCCRSIIPLLLPYLRIRKEQAKILLEFLSIGNGFLDEKEKMYLKIRKLNKRGREVEDSSCLQSESSFR